MISSGEELDEAFVGGPGCVHVCRRLSKLGEGKLPSRFVESASFLGIKSRQLRSIFDEGPLPFIAQVNSVSVLYIWKDWLR